MIQVHFRQKVSLLMLLAMVIVAFPYAPTQAARPDSLKDVLSDSRKSTVSVHTITLNQAAGTTPVSTETVTVTFPAGFTVPTFVAADATWTDNGASKTVQDAVCGATDTVRITVSGQVVTFTACTSYSGTSGSDIVITLGGTNKATNHASAGTYQMAIAGSYGDDSQEAAIVITDGVTVSATIDETNSLTVAGVTTGNCPNPIAAGAETEIDTSGSAVTVPFGTINSEAFYGACQLLTSGTNAASGYATTVQTTSLMTSGLNTIAKGTCSSASCTDVNNGAWATAGDNGMGYCMADSAGNAAVTADADWSGGATASDHGCNATASGVTHFKTIANAGAAETAQSIMASATPVGGDASYIKYRLTADAAQAAGAYQTTIVYIQTATF